MWRGKANLLGFILCFEIPSAVLIPGMSSLFFSFQCTHKSLHWSLLSCENKNYPKRFKKYSEVVRGSICQREAETDSWDREDYNQ